MTHMLRFSALGLSILPLAAPAVAGPERQALLSATWLGQLAEEEGSRIAISWKGDAPAWIEVFEDTNGDGRPGPGEPIVLERAVEKGMEVLPVVDSGTVAVGLRWRGDGVEGVERLRSAEKMAGCEWQPGFSLDDLDGTVHALAVWDDGGGEALYAAGFFTTAGGVTVDRVAKWDGSGWSALSGPSGTGVNGTVFDLAVWDDGGGAALYAGGLFTTAGGVVVNGVAKWDGSGWSALSGPSGTGANDTVLALAVWDDGGGAALYAGGRFTTAGGVTVNRVAKWDGSSWSALSGPAGTGVASTVWALAVWDDGGGAALYAGGDFATAGGVVVNHVARWDGSGWSALSGPSGTGTNFEMRALAVWDDGGGEALYAGGYFTTAGGVVVNRVAKWDGGGWSALSGPSEAGVSGVVLELAVWDDGGGEALYAGGTFTTAGGVSVDRVAKWDGVGWSALSGPSGTGTNNTVLALAAWDDGGGGALYAGGDFTTAGGVGVDRLAKWDGSVWSTLSGPSGMGVGGTMYALAVWDDGGGEALYAGGFFTTAGGVVVNRVAKWDGIAWSALSGPSGTGMDNAVYALAVWDDGGGEALYAGGFFSTAGGTFANRVAKWDGSAWSALSGPSGTGADGTVWALAVWDDGGGEALYAGGDFTTAGGVTANRLAKWDGSAWSALSGPSGTGTNNTVRALAVWDDGGGPALYAGGDFTTAGGVIVNRVAKWDGSGWSALSGPSGTGTNNTVRALAVWDDGGGAELYAAGDLTTAGGVVVNRVARWDGSGWSALSGPSGTGVNSTVYDLAGWTDGGGAALYAGGDFSTAGGLLSIYIGKYACEAAAPADPTAVSSPSHTISAYTADPTIDVQWSGAFDEPGGSGLDRYRVLFDDQPTTVPDDTTTVPHTSDPHSTTSTVLTDGLWYFHLSTCDAVGNCTATVHRGPYGIDTAAPSTPAGVVSTSHTVGAPSADATIDTEWDASSDATSGVAGYAWTFLGADSWSCDGVIDGTGVSTSSPELSSGEFWFHVCTVDEAGNQSAVTTIGPFELDLVAPAVVAVDTVADTGDGELVDGESTGASITQLLVSFDEALASASATEPSNWSLVATGPDGVFDSTPCAKPDAGDLDFAPTALTLLAGDDVVRLDVGGGFALPRGRYRLDACPGITDAAGNPVALTELEFESWNLNLVANPNLDEDLAGWSAGGSNPGGLAWSVSDAEAKPTSGSLAVTTSGSDGATTTASICVDIEPGQPIVFGGALEYLTGGGGSNAQVTLHLTGSTSAQCLTPTGAAMSTVLATAPTAGWVGFAGSKPGSFVSVEAEIEVTSGTAAGQVIRFDLLSLDGPIFVDGFESGDTGAWSARVP
jgi:hypothetical protein